MKDLTLKKGSHYMVKTEGIFVRRFFKGTEKRFDSITCYVFSSKVNKKVRVEYNEQEESFYMTAPINTPTPSNEISIPSYCLEDIREVEPVKKLKDMKAFEVKLSVAGGSKDQTRTVFVEAQNKKEVQSAMNVLKVWDREDMKPEECPMKIEDGMIAEKEV